jgi:Zn-dependent alcohol dehydrogenase
MPPAPILPSRKTNLCTAIRATQAGAMPTRFDRRQDFHQGCSTFELHRAAGDRVGESRSRRALRQDFTSAGASPPASVRSSTRPGRTGATAVVFGLGGIAHYPGLRSAGADMIIGVDEQR